MKCKIMFQDKINASIAYVHHLYLDDDVKDSPLKEDCVKNFWASLNKNFRIVYQQNEQGINACQIMKDIDTAQSFLHGSGLPFRTIRAVIDDF